MAKMYLYVEDDRTSRMVMEALMETVMNINSFVIFEDSTDFMNRLKDLPTKPDIIFLDIHMEPLDGFSMLKLIRQDPEYSNTQVLALTASVMSEEVKELRQAGFDGAIGKPLDTMLFPSIIEKLEQGQNVWHIT